VVEFQIALSTLLVIGAGLFIRSLAGLNAVDPGFRTDHLLLAQIVLPQNRYPAGANVAFHQRMEQAIAAIPGVASVSPAEVPYLSGELLDTNFLPEGEANDPNRHQTEAYNAVGMHFSRRWASRSLRGVHSGSRIPPPRRRSESSTKVSPKPDFPIRIRSAGDSSSACTAATATY
jgi:hypothetical protein